MARRYEQELLCAAAAARAAAEILRESFHSGHGGPADLTAEREIRKVLCGEFPQYGYRGEELGLLDEPRDEGGHLWLVDPDDGTDAAMSGFRGSSVSIALLREGRPVLGVVYAYAAPDDAGDWFTWAEGNGPVLWNGQPAATGMVLEPTVLVSHRGDSNPSANAELAAPLRFRCVPSIAYRLALTAVGCAEAAVSVNGPTGWDYAGGHALLIGAGLELYDGSGKAVRYDRNGNSHSHGACFGGVEATCRRLARGDWSTVRRRGGKTDAAYGLHWPVPGKTCRDAGMLARAQGCWLGQLAGDALGSFVEFGRAEELQRKFPHGLRTLRDGGCWNTLAGQPTDDSEMALALARSILKAGGYDAEAAARAYAWWLRSVPFDKGGTTTTALVPAAMAADHGRPVAEAARAAASRGSQANGATMRVSPLAIYGAGATEEALRAMARRDAELTHPNAVCQDANAVFAGAIAFAIRTGAGAEEVFRYARESAQKVDANVRRVLADAESGPPPDYHTHMGWILVALWNAFWQLRSAGSAEEGIVRSVMAGGDTDTNAAIAGALLGAVYGREAIPAQWRDRVLSCRPIAGLQGVRQPRPEAFWPVDAMYLAESLLVLGMETGAR